MQMTTHARQSTRLWLIALTLCATAALVFPALSHAAKKPPHVGAAYTETNEPDNKVVVYARGADGSLTEIQRVDTGGAGVNGNAPFGQGFLDSNGAVELNGHLLFAVNAGDDTISSFRVGGDGRLTLADTAPSGGDHPTSIDTHKGLFYVLNVDSNDISGLRYSKKGELTPLSNSTRAAGHAARHDPGRWPPVPVRGPGAVQPGRQGADGPGAAQQRLPGPARHVQGRQRRQTRSRAGERVERVHPVRARVGQPRPPDRRQRRPAAELLARVRLQLQPVGHDADADRQPARRRRRHLLARDHKQRQVRVHDQPAAGPQRQRVRFSISRDGHLTLLGTTPTSGASADTALSRDSKYLFVQNIILPGQTGNATIDTYRVGSGGQLTHLGLVDTGVPGSASGFAAR